jgi:hypothetical protein
MNNIIVSGTLIEFLKKYAVLPYFGIFIVLTLTFRIHLSGDDQALLYGLKTALGCLSDTPLKIPCNAGVLHFPIFQYLIGAPFKLAGFSDPSIKEIFGLMSVAWSLIAAATFWRAGVILSGKPGGHLGMLVLLSGYLLVYMTATFNEAASFALFALLVLSVIDHWRIFYVCGIAFACTITKEVAFPFVLYFMFLSFYARELRVEVTTTFFKRTFKFLAEYKYAISSVIAGVTINLAFNYFRFGSIENLHNFDPALFTPWAYVPSILLYLFISPAAGLIFTWLSLCVLLVVPMIFLMRDRTEIFIISFTIIGLIVANIGLARWYSPFGWMAWGPRLTLPFLGAIGILGVYLVAPKIITYFQSAYRKNWSIIIFLIVAASSLPNIAVRLDQEAFFTKIFAPTKVAISSGLPSFTVQSAPAPLYQKATLEASARSIIIPTTIETIVNNWPIIFLWLVSLFYIWRQLLRPVQDINEVLNTSNSRRHVICVTARVKSRLISIELAKKVSFTLTALLLLISNALFVRTHREACPTCFDFLHKIRLGEVNAEYHLIASQEVMVKGLDNFPATLPLANIQIELSDSAVLEAVSVSAIDYNGNDIGNWTTRPISHLWGIGVVDNVAQDLISNNGPRKNNLKLPIGRKLTFLIPDNGNLTKNSTLYIQIYFDGGKRANTLATYKK